MPDNLEVVFPIGNTNMVERRSIEATEVVVLRSGVLQIDGPSGRRFVAGWREAGPLTMTPAGIPGSAPQPLTPPVMRSEDDGRTPAPFNPKKLR